MNIGRTLMTLSVAGVTALSVFPVDAQNGLRVPTLPTHSPRSQFLVDAGGGGIPGFFSPESSASASRLSWLSASWHPTGDGLRASLGLVWRDPQQGNPLDAVERAGESEWFGRPTTPYIGLGWSGSPSQGSRLQFSAELGTMLLGSGDCNTAGCLRFAGNGTRIGGEGSGIRINPYISFGASYRY